MKHIDGVALRAGSTRFEILDQTRLPDAEVWLDGAIRRRWSATSSGCRCGARR